MTSNERKVPECVSLGLFICNRVVNNIGNENMRLKENQYFGGGFVLGRRNGLCIVC